MTILAASLARLDKDRIHDLFVIRSGGVSALQRKPIEGRDANMHHMTVNARVGRRLLAIGAIVIAATLISGGIDRSCAGAQELKSSTPGSGRIWYEKYCTPCHGAGGVPGSAVFAKTKQPVDLQTYVQRHGGKFPAGDWLMVVFAQPLQNPHTAVWERIRKDQPTGTGSDVAARAKIRSIADYVLSIQAK